MRVLLTGAFGNVGQATLNELLAQGHQVRCFDLPSPTNQKAARACPGSIDVVWGDLRRPEDVARAVRDQEAVVHLAFIIPKLSATGLESEKCPDVARAVNVDGTHNLIVALESLSPVTRLVFASSLHVFGLTQDQPPPRTCADPVKPTENYSRHKIVCEEMIRASHLPWAILRLAATPPLRLIMDAGMFDVPLDNRIEFVHRRDVALAITNAVASDEVWGQTLLIGGGPRCQFYYRDFAQQVLEASGIGMLPAEAFSTTPFATDWLDTSLSRKLLHYQRHTLQDYTAEVVTLLGLRRPLIQMCRPAVRAWLLRQSPYLPRPRRARAAAKQGI
jgi:UDP-glucose 4-epimerase